MMDLDLDAIIQPQPPRRIWRPNWTAIAIFTGSAAFWFWLVWMGCKALGLTWE